MEMVDEAIRQLKDYRCMVAGWKKLEQELRLLKDDSARYHQCARDLARTRHRVLSVERAVAALPPSLEQLLSVMFLDTKERSVEQLADVLGVSVSSLYRRRRTALERFALAYYGAREETVKEE